METPFTKEQFFDVFKNYNMAVFPMQVVLFTLGIMILYFTLKQTTFSDKIVSAILGFFWLWMGIVYHLIFFSPINKAAYLFSGLFIIQGLLLWYFGYKNRVSFAFIGDKIGIVGYLLIAFSLLIYPFLGYQMGHIYPISPTFGLPCPTTIFTLGLFLMDIKRVPFMLLIIPLIWSVIGFTATFNFGILEDTGLLISGLTVLILKLLKMKTTSIPRL
jgi:Family of unknown function (DUF6064)